MANNLDKQTTPLSVRITESERAILAARAGEAGISAYVRAQLFASKKRGRVARIPTSSSKDVARLLAELGASGLAESLRELAREAALGVVILTPETELTLQDACRAVEAMRDALVEALGLESQS